MPFLYSEIEMICRGLQTHLNPHIVFNLPVLLNILNNIEKQSDQNHAGEVKNKKRVFHIKREVALMLRVYLFKI